jgi:hypothetical protein
LACGACSANRVAGGPAGLQRFPGACSWNADCWRAILKRRRWFSSVPSKLRIDIKRGKNLPCARLELRRDREPRPTPPPIDTPRRTGWLGAPSPFGQRLYAESFQ